MKIKILNILEILIIYNVVDVYLFYLLYISMLVVISTMYMQPSFYCLIIVKVMVLISYVNNIYYGLN